MKLLLLLRRANFFLERVAIRESHDDGILLFFSGLHDLTAFDHGIGCEKGQLPGLDLAIGAHDFADGRRVGYGNDFELRHVLVTPEPHGIGNHAIGRRVDQGKLHRFLEVGVAPAINIERAVRNILDAKNRRLAGGLIRRRILRASDANVKDDDRANQHHESRRWLEKQTRG